MLKAGCTAGGRFAPSEHKALPAELAPRPELEVRHGDLLMSRASGSPSIVGSAALALHPPERLMLSDKVFRLLVDKARARAAFVRYALASSPVRAQIEMAISGAEGLANNLPQAAVRALLIPCPDVRDQEKAAGFLDATTARIDSIIGRKEQLAQLLRERRSAHTAQLVTRGVATCPAMRPVDVEWLGSVPAHWELSRMRFLYNERTIAPRDDDGVVTAFRDGQVTLRERRRSEGFMLAEKEIGYQHVCRGDLVVHSMDAFAGAIGVSEDDGKCTPEYVLLTPRRAGLRNEYYAPLLRLMAHRRFILVSCPSVRERAPRLRFATLKDMVVPVPPPDEQDAIAKKIEAINRRFGDTVTSLERQIEYLREYRQALITAAVTGQLDIVAQEAA